MTAVSDKSLIEILPIEIWQMVSSFVPGALRGVSKDGNRIYLDPLNQAQIRENLKQVFGANVIRDIFLSDKLYQGELEKRKNSDYEPKYSIEIYQNKAIFGYIQGLFTRAQYPGSVQEAHPFDISSIQEVKRRCSLATEERALVLFYEAVREQFSKMHSNEPPMPDLVGNVGIIREWLHMESNFYLEQITELDLSDKGFTEVPGELNRLVSLTSLKINHSDYLFEMPIRIRSFSEKVALVRERIRQSQEQGAQFEDGQIDQILASIEGPSVYKIRQLPLNFAWPETLKCLQLSGNALEITPETPLPPNLEDLNFRCNGLTTIPPQIAGLTQLQVLNLAENAFDAFPSFLENFSNLRFLCLGFAPDVPIPERIQWPPGLEHLSIEGPLRTFPPGIRTLASLNCLNFNDNQIESLPVNDYPPNLGMLFLARNRINSIPAEGIAFPMSLEALFLDQNPLQEFPRQISKMEGTLYYNGSGVYRDRPFT